MGTAELLEGIRRELEAVYGDRLKGVLLYGSEARGDADPESDIDLMVLLQGPVETWKEIRRIVQAYYPLQLEAADRPIHAMPVDVDEFNAQEFAVYRDARREGLKL